MLIETNAFDTATATPVVHDHADAGAAAKDRKVQTIALVVLAAYLGSLIASIAVWGGFGALGWALVSVPLAGLWILYTTWVVPD